MQVLTHLAKEALAASRQIYPTVWKTDLHQSPWLSARSDCNAHLKLESQQVSVIEIFKVHLKAVLLSSGQHA